MLVVGVLASVRAVELLGPGMIIMIWVWPERDQSQANSGTTQNVVSMAVSSMRFDS